MQKQILISLAFLLFVRNSMPPAQAAGQMLPNGWRVTPVGRRISLPGDMPVNMMIAPDRRSLLISTAGFHNHSINVLDLATKHLVQSIDIAKNWPGMAVNPATGDIYLATGGVLAKDILQGLTPQQQSFATSQILHFTYRNGALTPTGSLSIAGISDNQWVAGLALGPNGALYTANTNTDTVYKLVGGVVQASARVGYRPYAVAISLDAKTLAVSNWGGQSVTLLNASSLAVQKTIVTGNHPNALLYGLDGRLYVANSGSNSVSVIKNDQVIETIKTSLDPSDRVGSTPIALSLSPDNTRLFVANADNNDVAVIDISRSGQSKILGFIPTAWYPSALAVSPDGRTLYVGTAKTGSRSNYPALTKDGMTQPDGSNHLDYVGDVLAGAVWAISVPSAKTLAQDTKQVFANVPKPAQIIDPAVARSIQQNAFRHIKHVLYIIRENRTYDQVMGDMAQGNGDPNLVLFGRNVTPNAHALAGCYVLIDNLYVNGEVSEDGHQWCNAAYATDFTEKGWINNYSGRNEPDADDHLTESPGGYLWDNCAHHGVTYRSYGEFATFRSSPNAPPVFTGNGSLAGHASLAWEKVQRFSGGRDKGKAQVFIDELREGEKTGHWPSFMVMHLGEDHTQGLSAGAFSPVAEVADNDQALGLIVQAVSHSKFWKSTAIFVIEDDAQDGPDHVDCHRTVGLVISPYIKRGFVDHTHYTTVSFVRTMELILGLPPMTQYDTAATPLYNSFATNPVLLAYSNLAPRVDLTAKNPKTGPGAIASAKLDFSDVDRADPQALNHILWNALRPGTPMPAPVHSTAWNGS
jgi:YVTN family beta-propeller protein